MTVAIPRVQTPVNENFLFHLRKPQQDLIGYLEFLAAQGDIVQLGFGSFKAIFVNHPDTVQQVLVTQASKFEKPRTVKQALQGLLGYNLFSSDGEAWRVLRKAIQPAFHQKRIESYLDIMVDYTEQMLTTWSHDDEIDIPAAMMDLTLGITTMALFNQDLRNDKAVEAVLKFLDLFTERIASPFPTPLWLPTAKNRDLKNTLKVADELLLPLIEERRQSGADKGDLLSMLILAQSEDKTGILTNEQIRNEVYNLFAAGFEVTGYTLSFILYLIAQHPLVEARLIKELDDEIGKRRFRFDDLDHLPYLEMVVNEGMRLFPVTTVVSRQAIADVQVGEYVIPRGAQVLVSPWTLHRREDIFPAPLRFDPQRFSEDKVDLIPKHAFIPFSMGPRICVGNAFAKMQIRANIATIYQRFRLSPLPDYQLTPIWRLNTQPKDGLPMIAHDRRLQTNPKRLNELRL